MDLLSSLPLRLTQLGYTQQAMKLLHGPYKKINMNLEYKNSSEISEYDGLESLLYVVVFFSKDQKHALLFSK